MARRRQAGEPFDEAWLPSLRATVPADRVGFPLREVLGQTRGAWQRAYQGQPPAAGERACRSLVALLGEADEARGGER